jgi:RNA polymerase sigma-70 factor (ECF subfamily)
VELGTDAEAIEASRAEPTAFAVVYDRHAAVVFRFLVRRVGRDTADELLGETFRIAFQRRSSFDCERVSARPWLYGIASNLVAKYRRSEARRMNAFGRMTAACPTEEPADAAAAAVDAQRSWPEVARRVAALPDAERDALLLFAWEELSYEEVAAALNIPVGTVRSRLSRARRRLREPIAPVGKEPAP